MEYILSAFDSILTEMWIDRIELSCLLHRFISILKNIVLIESLKASLFSSLLRYHYYHLLMMTFRRMGTSNASKQRILNSPLHHIYHLFVRPVHEYWVHQTIRIVNFIISSHYDLPFKRMNVSYRQSVDLIRNRNNNKNPFGEREVRVCFIASDRYSVA